MKKNKYTLEWSIEETKKEIMAIFLGMDKDYFRARAADVEDISDSMIRIALGINKEGIEVIDKDVIVVAKDLKTIRCITG